jgi:transcriptional regulator with XRE-family HTH domain
MVLGIPSTVLTVGYNSLKDLRSNLSQTLGLLVPILFDRKMSFGSSEEVVLGTKIRELGQQNHISDEDLAIALDVTIEDIRRLEEKPDRISNPSLLLLRKLATVLKVSVAELIVPDYSGLVATQIVELLQERAVLGGARNLKEMPPADRRRFWRRVMERALQEMGRE